MLGPRILASPPTQSLTVMMIGTPGSNRRRSPRRMLVQAITFHGCCHWSMLLAGLAALLAGDLCPHT